VPEDRSVWWIQDWPYSLRIEAKVEEYEIIFSVRFEPLRPERAEK